MKNSVFIQIYGRRRQKGISLVVVMMVLLVVTVAGIAGARLSLLGEMTARSDRDSQIAFEAADAAIIDAENEIDGQGAIIDSTQCASLRVSKFLASNEEDQIPPGTCQNTSGERGLCKASEDTTVKPLWASVDFLDTSANAYSAEYGSFTCRAFNFGSGIRPAMAPRYIIERLNDFKSGANVDLNDKEEKINLFRITAIGFGPRIETRAVVQVEYVKKEPK